MEIGLRGRLLWINVVNTWQQETAYFGNSWGNLASTIMYTLTYLVFIHVIFANTRTLAGYSKDEMLLLLFVIQVNFYLIQMWSYNNVIRMVDDVNMGSFDMLLTKPLPALYYSSIRSVNVLTTLRDGIPSLTLFALAITWSNLHTSFVGVLAGAVIVLLGQLAMNVFFFLLGVPVFWFGQSADLLGIGYSFMSVNLPYEGVGRGLRLALTSFVPCLLASGLAVSVMIGKSDAINGLAYAALIAGCALLVKIGVWKMALRSYTSASS